MTTESGVGAAPATLAVVATGSVPTLTFGAPTLSGPATGSTTQIRYTGSGASQPFTATSSTASAARLDTFTVHAKVDNAAGFPSGVYTVSTIVTCGQP
ncbi:hypothetical protein Q9K02_00115 [Qipengyuania sp. G39]|uniref:Bacterial Ig-like domain-containing protein n=1 Tax=Qipengyuania profundimaris TaxID=3067652 RepID=A0ABT9HK55_9SPHN|nr:hypothetical protein [Qipengyuania sp. G39]MDP4573539.1 hypothetical protein [Qipengyuania sp. G39]